jgi:hypothetical protein
VDAVVVMVVVDSVNEHTLVSPSCVSRLAGGVAGAGAEAEREMAAVCLVLWL